MYCKCGDHPSSLEPETTIPSRKFSHVPSLVFKKRDVRITYIIQGDQSGNGRENEEAAPGGTQVVVIMSPAFRQDGCSKYHEGNKGRVMEK